MIGNLLGAWKQKRLKVEKWLKGKNKVPTYSPKKSILEYRNFSWHASKLTLILSKPTTQEEHIKIEN